jgi:hypothetical protein
VKFSGDWAGAASEKSEKHDFIRAFLNVFRANGIVGEFEKTIRTADGRANFIDFFWKGKIAIEMKSRGKSLDAAFLQLKAYMELLPPEDVPGLWMVSDFRSIRIYRAGGQEHRFATARLKKHVRHFAALAGYEPEDIRTDKESVNVRAAEKMASLHGALKSHGYRGDDLQAYTARLLFCLFADDTGIFPQDSFYRYIEATREDGSDLNALLAELFMALDEPPGQGRVDGERMAHFRYIDGGLFKGPLRRAAFDKKMRRTLLDCLSFDWGQISPAIFGSMFQGAMEGIERRELGAHYTSEENILKLIDPLFMDGLRQEFADARCAGYQTLAAFHDRLATLKFLDPACGCGNFLIVAYRELRRLELDVVRAKRALLAAGGQKDTPKHLRGIDHPLLDVKTELRVAIEQFHGIEILPWPCQLARTGLWLMDHLMNMEASDELGEYYARLPLTQGASIIEANALRLDWADAVPAGGLSYIMGNPPFSGARLMTKDQKADMAHVFGDTKGLGNLDYVTAWYRKAAECMGDSPIRAAFVSTNSISQGEQAALLWKPLMEERGLHIDFARRTFRWTNEARGRAAVHCVIVGFSAARGAEGSVKCIYDGGARSVAGNINPYLVDGPTVFIERRARPLCDGAPSLGIGNKPIDDGSFLFTGAERAEFLKREPAAKKWFRRWVGADEFINGHFRHFLFLRGCPPDELRKMPECMRRVEAVRKFRAASKSEGTRKIADTPLRFHVENLPETQYIVVPKTSSETRRYIPMGFMPPSVLAGDAVMIGAGAALWHFGVLMSSVHMAWIRATCGRFGTGYRYSVGIVYNNFPWPDATKAQMARVEALARAVLDARALFPGSSLADLYDPNSMPPELAKAHRALDQAVIKLYGFAGDAPEPEIVADLMGRYARLAK